MEARAAKQTHSSGASRTPQQRPVRAPASELASLIGNRAFSRAALQRVIDWHAHAPSHKTVIGALKVADPQFSPAGFMVAAGTPERLEDAARPERADGIVDISQLREAKAGTSDVKKMVTSFARGEQLLAQGAFATGDIDGGHLIGGQFFPDDASSFTYENIAPQWSGFNSAANALEGAIAAYAKRTLSFHVTAKLTYGSDLRIPAATVNKNLAARGGGAIAAGSPDVDLPRRIPNSWTLRARVLGEAPAAGTQPGGYAWGSANKPGTAPLTPDVFEKFAVAAPNAATGETTDFPREGPQPYAPDNRRLVFRPSGQRPQNANRALRPLPQHVPIPRQTRRPFCTQSAPAAAAPLAYAVDVATGAIDRFNYPGGDAGARTMKVRGVQWTPYVGRARKADWFALVKSHFPQTAGELATALPEEQRKMLVTVNKTHDDTIQRLRSLDRRALPIGEQLNFAERVIEGCASLSKLQREISDRINALTPDVDNADQILVGAGHDFVKDAAAILAPLEDDHEQLEHAEQERLAEVARAQQAEVEEEEEGQSEPDVDMGSDISAKQKRPREAPPQTAAADGDATPADGDAAPRPKRARLTPPSDLAATMTTADTQVNTS